VQYNIDHPGTMFFRNSTLPLNMLEAARQQGVERFMSASSTCVYSPTATVPNIEEDGFKDNPDESNIGYGWAKRVAELGARFYSKEFGMKIAIVRPANIYGPRDNFDSETFHVIPALIKRVFQSTGNIEVWGSGRQTRAFIYVKDVVSAMMLATEKYTVVDPINIGTDEEVTIKELIELIIGISGKELAVKFDTGKPEGQVRKAAAISRIKEKLDWSPSYSLEKGLKETIAWYREVPQH
ncbi:NAD-dependent epimerase/dehydratase family protein, partial [Chloroflexota bacterium]